MAKAPLGLQQRRKFSLESGCQESGEEARSAPAGDARIRASARGMRSYQERLKYIMNYNSFRAQTEEVQTDRL